MSARSSPVQLWLQERAGPSELRPPRRPQDRAKQGTPPNSVSKGKAKISSSRGEARVCHLTVRVWGWVYMGGVAFARIAHVRPGLHSGARLWNRGKRCRMGLRQVARISRDYALRQGRENSSKARAPRNPKAQGDLRLWVRATTRLLELCTPGAFSGSHRVEPPEPKRGDQVRSPRASSQTVPSGLRPYSSFPDHSHACTSPRSSRLQDLERRRPPSDQRRTCALELGTQLAA